MSEIPLTVSYTDADLQAQKPQRPSVPTGAWAKFVVKSAERDVWPRGSLRLKLVLNPVSGENQVDSSMREFYDLTMPFRNPNKEGHKAPRTKGLVYGFIKAIDPDFRPYPTKDEEGNWLKDGSVLDEAGKKDAFDSADREVMDRIAALWQDPSILEQEVFYAKKVEDTYEKDGQTKTTTRIQYVQGQPPVGENEVLFEPTPF